MTLLRRILITVIVTFAVVFVGVNWIVPVALSFYAAQKAPPVARVVPTDLNDQSVSDAPGSKLLYFGYEFDSVERPRRDANDLVSQGQTREVQSRSSFSFRIAIDDYRASSTSLGQRSRQGSQCLPHDIESAFGHETKKSDYSFMKALYEFTPDNVNHWIAWQDAHNRDKLFLIIKSLAPPQAAETGIFNLQNHTYKGFQLGNPRVRPDRILVDLYSDENAAEMTFLQKDYRNTIGVTQPEINRIVRSLHRVSQDTPAATQTANN